ncbi:MAG: pilus assembly protein [Rhizobiaceae bacterium]|nr:pilus assembly protein [Rhizobiaceae bacterium]
MFLKRFKQENAMGRFLVKCKLLRDDESGVAALEFAIIAPILILLFLGTIEISLAIAVDRKISRISSSVADLITRTQFSDLPVSEMDEFVKIANRIMYPYQDSVAISIMGIDVVNGSSTVRWRYTTGGGTAPAPGQPFTVPANIRNTDAFLIAAVVKTDHSPAVGFINYDDGKISFDGASIELSEQMFLRPRRAKDTGIDCSACT